MAYPFTPMPTMREFIDRAVKEYGVVVKEPNGALIGPRGATKTNYLMRGGSNGKVRFAILQNINDNERLNPNILRSLCRQLAIPVQDFGLTLG